MPKKQKKDKDIEQLFELFLKSLTEGLEKGDCSPGFLGVVSTFLKNNNITIDFSSVKKGETAHSFLNELPYFDEED